MSDVVLDKTEIDRRTIRRTDWVACNAAFIDCRTPGSDKKENYAFIGSGVSQNPAQVVNLTENHGFNTGAAGMPSGISNNLHLHFTAEVFINLGGQFRLRWGVDGKEGEYVSTDGDIISVPTWIFRGFTNEGPDDGILYTVLGRDVTGGHHLGALGAERGQGLRPVPHGRQPPHRHRRRRRGAGGRRAHHADAAALHRRAVDLLRRGDAPARRPAGRPQVQPQRTAVREPARRCRRARPRHRLRHDRGPPPGARRSTSRTRSTSRGCARPRTKDSSVTATTRRRPCW